MAVPTCNRENSWKIWLATEFENQSIDACKIRAITFWAIWHNRNKIYHDGVREPVNEVVGFIKAYYAETNVARERLKNSCAVGHFVWEPPVNDTIKINFDSSFNQLTKCSISGIIARNKEGLIMAACTYPWENIADPVMAEARACLQAVILAEDMGFQEVKGDQQSGSYDGERRGRYEHPRFWIEEAPHAVEILINHERRNNIHGG